MPDTTDDLRDELLQAAFLYDDPEAYRAGVEHALDAATESPASHAAPRPRLAATDRHAAIPQSGDEDARQIS